MGKRKNGSRESGLGDRRPRRDSGDAVEFCEAEVLGPDGATERIRRQLGMEERS